MNCLFSLCPLCFFLAEGTNELPLQFVPFVLLFG